MLSFFYSMLEAYDKPQKIYIFKNKVITFLANIIMPAYYKLNRLNGQKYKSVREDVIVSLTSYPGRINQASRCIQSLLNQTIKPHKIILWLSYEEYPSIESVPKELIYLQNYGLEIRFCENLRSYKKILYSAKLFGKFNIVTADDDFYYPPYWLEELISTHDRFPNNVICHRTHGIRFDAEHNLKPYGEWDWYSNGKMGPSHWLHTLTGAGTLFPPNFFDNDFFDVGTIKRCAPTTDDLWIKVYCIRKNVEIVKVHPVSKELITIYGSQKQSLISENQSTGNDAAFSLLLEHYGINLYEFLSGSNNL